MSSKLLKDDLLLGYVGVALLSLTTPPIVVPVRCPHQFFFRGDDEGDLRSV